MKWESIWEWEKRRDKWDRRKWEWGKRRNKWEEFQVVFVLWTVVIF